MTYWERFAQFAPEMLRALQETAVMMGIALLAALVLGLPLGVLLFLSRKDGLKEQPALYTLGNTYVDVVRSFPFLLFVVALIPLTRFVLGTAFGTYAAAFPLSFVGVAIYSRLVEQVLLDVAPEVLELSQALGASNLQLVREFLLVEGRSGLLLSFISTAISLLSYSTVMGVVGGGGVGDFALRYGYQRYEYDVMYTTIFIMIVIVLLVQQLGNSCARKIDHRK